MSNDELDTLLRENGHSFRRELEKWQAENQPQKEARIRHALQASPLWKTDSESRPRTPFFEHLKPFLGGFALASCAVLALVVFQNPERQQTPVLTSGPDELASMVDFDGGYTHFALLETYDDLYEDIGAPTFGPLIEDDISFIPEQLPAMGSVLSNEFVEDYYDSELLL